MIVPMKKVSLILLDSEKKKALKILRKLGVLQIEITEGNGERLTMLQEQISSLEKASFILSDKKDKNTVKKDIEAKEAILIAQQVLILSEQAKSYTQEIALFNSELERLKGWGEVNPKDIYALSEKGVLLSIYEMPNAEYKKLDENIKTITIEKTKKLVRFAVVIDDLAKENNIELVERYKVQLPKLSTDELRQSIIEKQSQINDIQMQLKEYARYTESLKKAVESVKKEVEFEIYATGMPIEHLSYNSNGNLSLAVCKGYIPTEDSKKLKTVAKENAWGLLLEEPTPEDDVPTKLKNNKFVSLVYPLTDFLGTVPGYFEFDISGWFLGFILMFFGIIFGDGGYGLLILAIAGIFIISALAKKKKVASAFWLIALMGLSTIVWGMVTCTWFGLSATQLPNWLQKLSIPLISNVYADKIWYPFWTEGKVGLTTTQNVQIFCFALALVQLVVAHIISGIRNRKSLKVLGDIGSIMQLLGMFYVVLSLVVNGAVFGLDLVIGGVPIGIVAIVLVGVGFVLSFVFANYEGSIGTSILESLKNIISVLLGVVNVFSDIVSYIRLWAVGIAGAAISATVNALAGPLLGNLVFVIVAIVLLVFGHGLNMILNVLSVIVHGVRLNTLEFSSHLGMSWSGRKFTPFEE